MSTTSINGDSFRLRTVQGVRRENVRHEKGQSTDEYSLTRGNEKASQTESSQSQYTKKCERGRATQWVVGGDQGKEKQKELGTHPPPLSWWGRGKIGTDNDQCNTRPSDDTASKKNIKGQVGRRPLALDSAQQNQGGANWSREL